MPATELPIDARAFDDLSNSAFLQVCNAISFCVSRGDLDAYMRVRFKGRRADILNLVIKHLAPNNPEMAVRILSTITEA